MADNVTTPVPNGTVMATKDLAGVHIPKNAIVDQAGADVFGLVTASPAANSVLGRLKAAVDALGEISAALGGTIDVALGSAVAITAESLPLPSGAATAAKQDAVKASIDATALVAVPFPITPHDTNALSRPIKAIALQVAGAVKFAPVGGGSDVTVNLPAGMFQLPATHIRSTGTTATGLTGF